MSEENKNLTPWQQKHLEYERKKAEEAKKNQPKTSRFSKWKSAGKADKAAAEQPETLEEEPVSADEIVAEQSEELTEEINPADAIPEGFLPDELLASEDSVSADESSEQAQSEFADEAHLDENGEIAESELTEETAEAYMHQTQQQIFSQLDSIAQEVEAEANPPREPFFASLSPVFKKMWPALLVVFLIFLGSIYAVSPLSKIGKFTVSGNQNETIEQIAQASQLKTGDTIFSIISNRHAIADRIEKSFPRVESVKLAYHFPNNFEAVVKEHASAVYVVQNKQTYLVLDDGYIIKTPVDTKNLQKLPTLQNFSDAEVKTFVQGYESLKPAIKALMGNVTKTPTDATKDFIAIDMSDGNQVRVPLSQIASKMPYYPSVAAQVKAPQVVDMEAGIYTTPTSEYMSSLSQLESSKSVSISESISASQSAAVAKGTAPSTSDSTTTTTTASSSN